MLSYFQTSCLGRITYAPTSTTPRYSAMSAREYCWICNKGNSRPVRTPVSGTSVVRGLRCAHPRLSPFGLRLWGHASGVTPFRRHCGVERHLSRRWRRTAKSNKRRRCLTMLNRWCSEAKPAEACLLKYVPRSGTTLFDIFDAE